MILNDMEIIIKGYNDFIAKGKYFEVPISADMIAYELVRLGKIELAKIKGFEPVETTLKWKYGYKL